LAAARQYSARAESIGGLVHRQEIAAENQRRFTLQIFLFAYGQQGGIDSRRRQVARGKGRHLRSARKSDQRNMGRLHSRIEQSPDP
jgi:hypothetical protein